jgi:hypothetical protein
MKSLPAQCRDPKTGITYVEEISRVSTSTNDMIQIVTPAMGAVISSPVTVTGKARGPWFFEANFPVEVRSNDGTILGTGPVQAQGEWMTTEYVSFSAAISFNAGNNKSGFVRFRNDNPSGDPERDMYVDVPVTFGTSSTGTPSAKACRPTGCSSQICSDEDIASTCEYRSEYACYKTAQCKRQADGVCGWTQTPELAACLTNSL